MHQVLSFQMARGFGESSEFVTKRMCFSFLFSVGFLCLLGGFLLGRFVAERAVEMHAEKTRVELAGNGLESTEHLQQLLLQRLEEASFVNNYATNLEGLRSKQERIVEILTNLRFVHQIVQRKSCIIATIRGSREPDRFVVLSANGEGITITLELARILQQIHSEYNWKPRRTLLFCIFLDSQDCCHETLSNYVRPKVLAYIAVHGNAVQENGHFVVSGSDIVKSTVIQATNVVQNPYFDASTNNRQTIFDVYEKEEYDISFPRLTLDIPHATLSFVNEKNASSTGSKYEKNIEGYRKALAQIVGVSMWRLSDSVILRWNPKDLNDTVNNALDTVDSMQFGNVTDQITAVIKKLVNNAESLNNNIEKMERSKSLDVRMTNDLLMDLDRALLCPDRDYNSKTDLVIFFAVLQKSSSDIMTFLKEMQNCYETANEVLQEA